MNKKLYTIIQIEHIYMNMYIMAPRQDQKASIRPRPPFAYTAWCLSLLQ